MVSEGLPIARQRDLKERASEEFKRFIVIFLYLWIVFWAAVAPYESRPVTAPFGLPGAHVCIINAFVCAKVLLLGEHFHLGTRFGGKPLIYPILHKCFVFTVLLISFHIIESVALGVWRGNTIANSLSPILGWNPSGLLGVGVICFVLLLPFFGFREIARVMGRREMWTLLFDRRGYGDKSDGLSAAKPN